MFILGMYSSSIHKLNADKDLGKPQKFLWSLLNWVNNNLLPGYIADASLVIHDFMPNISDEDWKQLSIKTSPSRKLCDLFWLKFPWELIKSEIGEIRVFDTGCGSGNYGIKLQSYSGNNITSYTGVDICKSENWDALTNRYKDFKFHQVDSKSILGYIPEETNFFMTQSALEHFEEDLVYFEQIREFLSRKSRNAIQVHLLPSSACRKLYRFHGVRQYTPRTISKITRIFQDFSYSVLFRLGGKECNALHWEFITKPLITQRNDLRNTKTSEYDQRLIKAIKANIKNPSKPASFYALVIHANWREKIFLRNIFQGK